MDIHFVIASLALVPGAWDRSSRALALPNSTVQHLESSPAPLFHRGYRARHLPLSTNSEAFRLVLSQQLSATLYRRKRDRYHRKNRCSSQMRNRQNQGQGELPIASDDWGCCRSYYAQAHFAVRTQVPRHPEAAKRQWAAPALFPVR